MSVKPHPTIEGAWQIDWQQPDPSKPLRKSGRHPLKRYYETYIGSYEDACSRWASLAQTHKTTTLIGNPRLNDIIPDYLEFIELNKSPGYYKSICWAMKKIKPAFGLLPVSNITRNHIETFKRKHRSTPAHCNQCLRYLKILISWMVEQGKAQPLPFKIILLPHKEKIAQPPSPEEYQLILKTIRENLRKSGTTQQQRATQEAAIHIMYTTGLRWKECRHLLWQNLRWEDGRCLVTTTKTGNQRYCTLPTEALDLIKPYKKRSGYIITNPATGKPYTTIRKLLKNAAEKHGIPLRGPHDLRHAAGTDTLEATGDIRAAQELLGHASLKSTQRYTHIAIKRQQRIAQLTAEFRKQQTKTVDKNTEDKHPK